MGRFIDKLWSCCGLSYRGHLSDETLAELFCGDLSVTARWKCRRHLAYCSHCRVRQEYLLGPRAQSMLQFYREQWQELEEPLSMEPRIAFSRWLDHRIREEDSCDQQSLLASWPFSRVATLMAGLTGIIIGSLCLSSLLRERQPNLSGNAILQRAQSGERFEAAAKPGVARQTIQIKTANVSLKRSLYWDLQGKRHLKQTLLPATEEKIRWTLIQAGVDWNRPISAAGYEAWRSHQQGREEHVSHSSEHLLTLTTVVPEGLVSEESLTVRDTDFHPVRRSIGFRNRETIEIAELDYSVLPWSAVSVDIFDPVAPSGNTLTSMASDGAPLLTIPSVSTSLQLEETELSARLILNQLHADTGEQIEVRRSSQDVEVTGLVETEDRKHELVAQLMTVPHLKISLQSAARLPEITVSQGKVVSIAGTGEEERPSLLLTYMRARGRTIDESNALSRRLFESALTISQESHALEELRNRFSSPSQLRILAFATLEELLYSHRERLQEALRQQREALSEARGSTLIRDHSPEGSRVLLSGKALRDLALVKELTRQNPPAGQSAETLLGELSETASAISDSMRETYAPSVTADALSARKR